MGLAQLGSKPLLLERLQGKGKQRERIAALPSVS